MKKIMTYQKTALSFVLVGLLATPLWAQDKAAADKTAITDAEVLSPTETQQFFHEMTADLAKDGYQITFKTLPKVTIQPPKVLTPVESKNINKPMSDKEKQDFFMTLQKNLANSGIHVDFGKQLPEIKRTAPQPDTACQEDLAELMLERYSDNLKQNELLGELLSEHYGYQIGADLTAELIQESGLAVTDNLDDDPFGEADILATLINKRHAKGTAPKDPLADLNIGDDVTIELLEALLEKAKKQR